MIERLCGQCILEKFDTHFFNMVVMNHCLKILLRQRKRGADGHATLFACDHLIQHCIFKYQISMHQQNVIVCQCFSCTVDGIDVVGLVIDRVLYKGVRKRQMQAFTVFGQYLVMPSGGHNHFLDPLISDLAELAA